MVEMQEVLVMSNEIHGGMGNAMFPIPLTFAWGSIRSQFRPSDSCGPFSGRLS